jgi:hypothetical protein
MALISRPVAEWPLVLCGPMLRRVTPQSVAVFVALKESCTAQVSLFDGVDPDQGAIHVGAPTNSIALGKNLHVALPIASVDTGLPPARVFGYQLTLQPASGGRRTLDTLGLLAGPSALGYQTGRLPSFSLPPSRLKDLNFLHGSCRKPHGGGLDAMVAVDDLIRDSVGDGTKRPHYLFLTGDQIYADDVAVALATTIGATGADLLAWPTPETMLTTATGAVPHDEPALKPGLTRRQFLKDWTKLSSEEIDGHLMFLGDFYAMYLMAWSDALWPRKRTSPTAPEQLHLPTAAEFLPSGTGGGYTATVEKQRSAVLAFAETLPRARRAFANVPTYMIFDDHEITDDWYLHRRWMLDARASPAGRRIIRNGLLAYAIFQAWGNDPSYFRTDPPRQLLSAVAMVPPAADPPISANPDACDIALDLQPTGPLPDGSTQRVYWGWGVDGPGHQVIALDTRTRRNFPARPEKANAGLMSSGALNELTTSVPAGDIVTILLSPAPVFGNPIIELLQQGQIEADVKAGKKGEELSDDEAWFANRVTFEEFLKRILRFKRVVILSGDVHYAFSNHVSYFLDGTTPAVGRFVNFCASSLKNENEQTHKASLLGYGGDAITAAGRLEEMGWLGFDADLTPTFGRLRNVVKRPDLLGGASQLLVQLLFDIEKHERFRRPAVVPTNGWAIDPAVDIVRELSGPPLGPPAWQYRVVYLFDARSPTEQAAAVPGLGQFLPPPAAVPTQKTGRDLIFDSGRAMVGANNVGRVSFRGADGAVDAVVQRLLYNVFGPNGQLAKHGPGAAAREVWMVTEHVAPLTTPTAADRPRITR